MGGTLVQPTEAGKFLLIIFMSWYLSWFYDRMHRLIYLILALVLLAIPLALVYLQPDPGMAIATPFGRHAPLVGGIRYWQIATTAAAPLAAVPFLWSTLQGHMLERIQVFRPAEQPPRCSTFTRRSSRWAQAAGWARVRAGQPEPAALFACAPHRLHLQCHRRRAKSHRFGETLALEPFFVVWRLLRIADRLHHFGRLIATGVAALISSRARSTWA
ncbi:MAG: FtsW/RodA/SpoVE family cell cycle protein [Caldilineaceae bacterium]